MNPETADISTATVEAISRATTVASFWGAFAGVFAGIVVLVLLIVWADDK